MPSYPAHTDLPDPVSSTPRLIPQPDQNRDPKGAGHPHHDRSKSTPARRVQVALYVRVSTDKQADFGMSLDAQTAELERYCAERNWDAAETFVDGGFSAKDTDRPAFKRMVQRIKDGGIDAIAVTKLDRLTRSVCNLCEINEDILKGRGVHLVCTRDGINTFELTSSFLMHLLALIGQIERENTSKRVAAAIAHIHDSGGHYGKIPFGKMTTLRGYTL